MRERNLQYAIEREKETVEGSLERDGKNDWKSECERKIERSIKCEWSRLITSITKCEIDKERFQCSHLIFLASFTDTHMLTL